MNEAYIPRNMWIPAVFRLKSGLYELVPFDSLNIYKSCFAVFADEMKDAASIIDGVLIC